jgi:hypothetical protein
MDVSTVKVDTILIGQRKSRYQEWLSFKVNFKSTLKSCKDEFKTPLFKKLSQSTIPIGSLTGFNPIKEPTDRLCLTSLKEDKMVIKRASSPLMS